jgi:hypothetical protein
VTPETEIAQVDKAAGRAITSEVKITNQSVYRLRAPLWFVAKDLSANLNAMNHRRHAGAAPDSIF